jgi:hypothetical protein
MESNPDINTDQYSFEIKDKLAEKGKLCKLWQTNRCPVLKSKLNRAIKTVKNFLDWKETRNIRISK